MRLLGSVRGPLSERRLLFCVRKATSAAPSAALSPTASVAPEMLIVPPNVVGMGTARVPPPVNWKPGPLQGQPSVSVVAGSTCKAKLGLVFTGRENVKEAE